MIIYVTLMLMLLATSSYLLFGKQKEQQKMQLAVNLKLSKGAFFDYVRAAISDEASGVCSQNLIEPMAVQNALRNVTLENIRPKDNSNSGDLFDSARLPIPIPNLRAGTNSDQILVQTLSGLPGDQLDIVFGTQTAQALTAFSINSGRFFIAHMELDENDIHPLSLDLVFYVHNLQAATGKARVTTENFSQIFSRGGVKGIYSQNGESFAEKIRIPIRYLPSYNDPGLGFDEYLGSAGSSIPLERCRAYDPGYEEMMEDFTINACFDFDRRDNPDIFDRNNPSIIGNPGNHPIIIGENENSLAFNTIDWNRVNTPDGLADIKEAIRDRFILDGCRDYFQEMATCAPSVTPFTAAQIAAAGSVIPTIYTQEPFPLNLREQGLLNELAGQERFYYFSANCKLVPKCGAGEILVTTSNPIADGLIGDSKDMVFSCLNVNCSDDSVMTGLDIPASTPTPNPAGFETIQPKCSQLLDPDADFDCSASGEDKYVSNIIKGDTVGGPMIKGFECSPRNGHREAFCKELDPTLRARFSNAGEVCFIE